MRTESVANEMKIMEATETEGQITAKVRFPDGLEQSVSLPSWATKRNILDEAQRQRDEAETREQKRQRRADLED